MTAQSPDFLEQPGHMFTRIHGPISIPNCHWQKQENKTATTATLTYRIQ